MKKWIVVYGNVVDGGLEFFGPWDESEEAIEFMSLHSDKEWVLAPLVSLEQLKKDWLVQS